MAQKKNVHVLFTPNDAVHFGKLCVLAYVSARDKCSSARNDIVVHFGRLSVLAYVSARDNR